MGNQCFISLADFIGNELSVEDFISRPLSWYLLLIKKELVMSKKKMTPKDASRIQRAESIKRGGAIGKKSFAARAMKAAAKGKKSN